MTIQELNNSIHQLSANPARETAIEFAKSLMQFFGVAAEQREKVIGSSTQTLQKLLAENPRVKNQPLLYQLSSGNQNISCRFAVVKKINKPTLLRLCYQENFSQSWQANIGNAGTDNLPYTIDFITTEKYNAVTVVITQGEQIRTVTFRERLTNLQRNKMLVAWQNIIAKPKVIINTDVWSSLDIKEVNKQFYISIKEKFDALIAEIKQQYPDAEANEMKMFAIRLIGRYIFCWFLKEKEIIHPDVLSSASLEKYTNRYNKILKRLFFDTLNTFPFPERNYPKDVPQELLKHLSEIPYLNGGLFEPSTEDENIPSIAIDGWLLSFIRLLEEYNFTVDESSANYEQVAIDPEMLGRILENLLASLNPETEKIANERNALGAFYTPRPIVDYMVTESLKVFFESQLSDDGKEETADDNFFTTDKSKVNLFSDSQPKQMAIDMNKLQEQKESKEKVRAKIDKLFDYSIEQNPFSATDTKKLKQALTECKIIDPACGSGAFPMGVLHKLEMLHEKFGTDKSPYDLRRMILSQNIYGVDILPMAVEISRLRAWLALVLVSEYKRSDKKHNFNIKALPNLDFKFMCANTLVSVPENEFVDLMAAADLKLFEELTEKYFSSNTEEKATLKEEIQTCINNITRNHEIAIAQWIHEIERQKNRAAENKLKQMTEKLKVYEKQKKQWHSYKNIFAHGSVDFFDTKYFFPSVKNGFDIVIGNPPYVRQELITALKPDLALRFEVYNSTSDLYTYFYELTYHLLDRNGVTSFITSNNWLRAAYGKKLRSLIKQKTTIDTLIDFGDDQMFESAIVGTNIIVFKKSIPPVNHSLQYYSKLPTNKDSIASFINQNSLDPESFSFGDSVEEIIKTRIKSSGKILKEWNVEMNRGVTSGCNEAFYLEEDEMKSIVKAEPKAKGIIKNVLRGRNLERYVIPKSNNYLLFIPWHFPLHKEDGIQGASKEAEAAFKKQYPIVYAHLKKFKEELSGRNQAETGIRYEWYALQRCAATYYNDFDKEKIVWIVLSDKPKFALDTEGYYTNDSTFIMVGKQLKYLCAILNSKVSEWYFDKIAPSSGMGTNMWKKYKIELLPVVVPTDKQEKKIETIVEKIIEKKNENIQADTSKEEKQIDLMVYHLYHLTYDEAKIIDAELSEEEFNKHKL